MVLSLVILRWPTTKAVGLVFFRNNILIPAPSTAYYGCKIPDFRLHVYPLDSIDPSL
jgi:hypothetical protein